MNANTRKPDLLTPEQIAASRDRLLSEGFHPDSMAVRVHEQFLAAMQANRVNVEGACASMDALKAECERRQWQPIRTAPRDGTWILVNGEYGVEKARCGSDGTPTTGDWEYVVESATHWMPMPELPTPESEGA